MKYSKSLLLLFLPLISSVNAAMAQVSASTDSTQVVASAFWTKEFPYYLENPWIWSGLFMFSILAFAFYALYKSVMVISRKLAGEIKKEDVAVEVKLARESAWSRLMKSMTRSVPIAQEADVMLDHNYDGIRELDNQLPPWWKWGFYFTILFAIVYLFSYHVIGIGKLSHAEYASELKQAEMEKEERMKNAANNITDANVIVFTDESELVEGKNIFTKNCVACHGNQAQGNVGPNLTDEFWLHGGGIKNVFHTITEGVPNKGMISWKSQLAPKQIQEVASFILSLKGSNPSGAKEPQGDKWQEEIKIDSSFVVTDSTKITASAGKKL